MKKYDVINRLTEGGVVAVVRAENSEQAVKIAEACIDVTKMDFNRVMGKYNKKG